MPSPTSPTESMAALGHEYRTIRASRQQEGQKGSTSRRIEEQMEKVAERFERLLDHWVHDDQTRNSWREFFYHGAAVPDQTWPAPPLFRGENEAGAVVETREASDGGYDVFLDGIHVDHFDVPWRQHTDRFAPVIIGEWTCRETFSSPAEARKALDAFLAEPRTEPPWRWAPALFEDGLIDLHFSLTARGTRATSGEPLATEQDTNRERIHYCVLLANAGRSRVFTLEADLFEHQATYEPLTEVADSSNALARAQDSQRYENSRPGLRREGPHGPRHAVSDRRESQREDSQRQYIQRVVDVAANIWNRYDPCQVVLVASPKMLARLRSAIAKRPHGKDKIEVHEYAGDLIWQEAPALHDALAGAGLLPSRGRKPPVRPLRTPNPWQSRG